MRGGFSSSRGGAKRKSPRVLSSSVPPLEPSPPEPSPPVASPPVVSPPVASPPVVSPPVASPPLEPPTQASPLISTSTSSAPPAAPPMPNTINNTTAETSNRQGSGPTPPATQPNRRLELLNVTSKILEPSRLVLAVVTQIIHSHFDGPWIHWSRVSEAGLMLWWSMFKNQCKWDEARYPEELVWKAFKHIGGKHLRSIMSKAHSDKKKPIWMKQEIWVGCWEIWDKDPAYNYSKEVNKKNRSVATEKGTPIYRGGSVNTTTHKRRLKDETGKDPMSRDVFARCYKRKNGTYAEPLAQKHVETYDKLLEEATQATEGSKPIDDSALWIKAVGGSKRGRIFGMGSEALSMLQMTHYVHNVTHINSCNMGPQPLESMREEMRAEMSSFREEMSQGMTNITGKVVDLEQHVDRSVESVRIEVRLNNNRFEQNLVELMAKIGSFFAGKPSSS